jgi:hypothetical protein
MITDSEVLAFVAETLRPHSDVLALHLANTLKVLLGAATLPSAAGGGQTVLAALQAADPAAIIADRPGEPAKQVTAGQALQVIGLLQSNHDALLASGNALLLIVNTLAINPRASLLPSS